VSQMVAAGDVDLGLASPPQARLGLTFEPLFEEPLAVLISVAHPLARRRTLEAKDLEGCRVLLTEADCAYRATLERGLMEKGMNPYSGIEMGSLEGLKRAVQAGIGIAIVPAVSLRPPPARTVVKPLVRPRLSLTVGLILKNEPALRSKSLLALVGLLRSRWLGHGRSTPH
jgi:DNA-binding transcriptional LysR family regulator